jgi:hypothetical protein
LSRPWAASRPTTLGTEGRCSIRTELRAGMPIISHPTATLAVV